MLRLRGSDLAKGRPGLQKFADQCLEAVDELQQVPPTDILVTLLLLYVPQPPSGFLSGATTTRWGILLRYRIPPCIVTPESFDPLHQGPALSPEAVKTELRVLRLGTLVLARDVRRGLPALQQLWWSKYGDSLPAALLPGSNSIREKQLKQDFDEARAIRLQVGQLFSASLLHISSISTSTIGLEFAESETQ